MTYSDDEVIVYSQQTAGGSYQVIDKTYSGRKARVLYSTMPRTAQSGIPLDGNSLMLFGYNQRLIELITHLNPKSILVIGGGVYTLPMEVLRSFSQTTIDVVEPNNDLEPIARKYFNLSSSPRLNIYHDDGHNYLKTNIKKYDLIVIDAYQDDRIPGDLMLPKFPKEVLKSLNDRGLVVSNIISNLKSEGPISLLSTNYARYFKNLDVYPADNHEPDYYYDSNYLLIASNVSFRPSLKYPSIKNLLKDQLK